MKKKKKKLFHSLAERFRGDGVTPVCPHFEKCGGCMFQDIAYENQLLLKKEYINGLFDGTLSVDSVNPSEPLAYRNRMDMVCAFGKIGLREEGSYRFVTDVESCAIMQTKTNSLYRKLRPMLAEIEGYNYLSHKGYLRYAVFRQAYFTGETMVSFVTASRDNRLRDIISEISDDADSINIIFNDGLADQSFGEVIDSFGRNYIEESFDGIRYRITPNSFFQSNSPVALQMYRRIREEVRGRVLDLYSGVGSISLFTAGGAESVTGVEIVPEAVESALENRELNGTANADFIEKDAAEFVRDSISGYDTLILDPPRAGMHPKMLPLINEKAPDRIVYMSCNPATFRDDLAGLNQYEVKSFEAFDMFPQTPHVETLAVLDRVK